MELNPMRPLILILLTAILAGPPEAESCGPFLYQAQFSFVARPPEASFASGQLGILRPKYYRRYLVVAFRYLNGVPLNQGEITAFGPKQSIVVAVDQVPRTPTQQWIEARSKVPGASPSSNFFLDQFRQPRDPSFYYYENCLDDTFTRAAQTLRDRAARWGIDSPQLKEWLRGQDAVFKDCSVGDEIPPSLPANTDALLASDRQYQMAAARFYTQKYDDAIEAFGAVSRNGDSPWQDLGELMIARALIREATVEGKEEKLEDAQDALDRIIANPKLQRWHDTATGLREYVRILRDPDGTLQVLSDRLMHPQPGPEFARTLTDFTLLWDRRKDQPSASTELIDWIVTFQQQNWTHALEEWRTNHKEAWLIAALSCVPRDNPEVPSLLEAAHRVSRDNQAWASATFYGISIQLARGEKEAARQWADEATKGKAPPDVNNEVLYQRMLVARTWQEFLRYGPRVPVATGGDFADGRLEATDRNEAVFDTDFAAPFNEDVPLRRWVDAASNPLLPGNLQADIAQAGWTRAVLLGRNPEAQALAARWAKLRPRTGAGLKTWSATTDSAAARFEAVWFMLHAPGLTPELRDNWGRGTAVYEIDSFRDNWWRLQGPGSEPLATARFRTGPHDFLPEAERRAGQAEWLQLRGQTRLGAEFLSGQTVAWALANPDDPRVPEALHLAVQTTRYTNDQNSSTFPKQAFQLLHRRYPKSKWTTLTPYWY